MKNLRAYLFRFFLMFCTMVFLPLYGGAVESELHGFLDTCHGARVVSPERGLIQGSRTRADLKFEVYDGDAMAKFEVQAIHDGVDSSAESFRFREGYIQYEWEYFDLRAGRQIIIWGNGDGFQVTDIVSPRDYSQFLANDFDDMRIPVDAFKLRGMAGAFTLETVFIPVFSPAIVPLCESGNGSEVPWARELPSGLTLNDEVVPEKKLSNSELGAKLSLRNSFFDFSLLSFYGWNDQPLMIFSGTQVTPVYKREKKFGCDVTIPMGDFICRGEGVFSTDSWFMLSNVFENPVKKKTGEYLLGLDWNPGNNWSVSAQLYGFSIMDYDESISQDKHTLYGTFSLNKSLFRETLHLYFIVFTGLKHGDVYGRLSFDYSLNDSLKLTAGYDLFAGDEGNFGEYRDMDQVFVKAGFFF